MGNVRAPHLQMSTSANNPTAHVNKRLSKIHKGNKKKQETKTYIKGNPTRV